MGSNDVKHRLLKIGSWDANFFFFTDGYDVEGVLDFLKDNGATEYILEDAYMLMSSGKDDTGFTFTVPNEHFAVICIGPTSSGEEFINTLVHEIHHLAVAIADELGIDLESETPAYISGGLALEFADLICRLGCKRRK